MTETTQADDPLVVHTFEAARERVFAAWMDPAVLARWSVDGYVIRPGSLTIEPHVGRYEYCLEAVEDGEAFWLRYRIVELIPPELLVLSSGPMPEAGRPDGFVTTVRLDEVDGGTRLTFFRPYPPEVRPRAQASWSSVFDQLDTILRESA